MIEDLVKALIKAEEWGFISRQEAVMEFKNTINALQHGLEVGLFVRELEKKKK